MIASNITQFRELIFSDPALTLQLYAITTKADFTSAAINIASLNGILLAEADVDAAMNAGARSWLERWI